MIELTNLKCIHWEDKVHEIRSNIFENRIYILLKGKLDMEEIRRLSIQVIKDGRKLYSGFVKITDIRELAPAPEEVRLEIQNMMRSLHDMGMGGAIRIVSPQGAVTANQFQRTSRAAGYLAHEVSTPAEAERILDQMD